jgi:hypothetical protein
MAGRRWRPIVISILAVGAIWAIAVTGYLVARNARPTAEKLARYVESVDLSKLTPEERAKALKKLADQINGLSPEERRKARAERAGMAWFEQMTEAEKAEFLERTMPTGFKQMLTAFEELPEEKRRKSIEDALRRLRETQTKLAAGEQMDPGRGTNAPVLSEELEARVRSIGLKTFYSQSSAQTKAELAPVLEELQRVMESGRPFRKR